MVKHVAQMKHMKKAVIIAKLELGRKTI